MTQLPVLCYNGALAKTIITFKLINDVTLRM